MDRHKPETSRRLSAEYRERNREKIRAQQKATRLGFKLTVLEHYGKFCAQCGYDDYRALQIDHIENDGATHREELGGKNFSGYKFYDWLIKNNFPSGFQTLCANCNNIKQWLVNNPID